MTCRPRTRARLELGGGQARLRVGVHVRAHGLGGAEPLLEGADGAHRVGPNVVDGPRAVDLQHHPLVLVVRQDRRRLVDVRAEALLDRLDVVVRAAARLAALEDILRTEGLAAVVVEYDGLNQSSDYWMRLARRAQLAAEASGTTGLLLGWPVAASGFDSLWHVAPGRRQETDSVSPAAPWHPVWDICIAHARGGRPCRTGLTWDSFADRFQTCALADMADGQGDMPAMLPFADIQKQSADKQAAGKQAAGRMSRADYPLADVSARASVGIAGGSSPALMTG